MKSWTISDWGAFAGILGLLGGLLGDREEAEIDRRTSTRVQADTECLARELAAIRLALGEMPTRDYLAEELDDLKAEVQRLRAQVEVDRDADPAPTND